MESVNSRKNSLLENEFKRIKFRKIVSTPIKQKDSSGRLLLEIDTFKLLDSKYTLDFKYTSLSFLSIYSKKFN